MYIYIYTRRQEGAKAPSLLEIQNPRVPESKSLRVPDSQIPRGAKAPSWNCELDVKVGAKAPTLTRVAAF